MTRQERLELLDVIKLDVDMLRDTRYNDDETGFMYHHKLAMGNIKDLMSDIRRDKNNETK